MSESTSSSDADAAARHIELANINQDSLWKRRQLEWKQNFLLWAALGIATAFFCKTYTGSEDNEMPRSLWWVLCVALALLSVAYTWHRLMFSASAEVDLAWLHYYKQQAEMRLGAEFRPDDILPRPDPRMRDRWRHLRNEKGKLNLGKLASLLPRLLVTYVIMIAALVLLWSKT